jgi:adenosine deaminase/adenosine deaminase CECR1
MKLTPSPREIAHGLALACLLLAQGAGAADASRDLAATRSYYNGLIRSTPQKLAELGMFTTLLPKGGDLHHHYTGALYAETYLDWVDAQHYCIYTATVPNTPAEKLRVNTKPDASLDPSLCVSAATLRQDSKYGRLYRELLSTWSDKDFDNHFHDQPPPDKQFFDTFGYFGAVSGYDFRQGLRDLKARARAENLGYLETMLAGAPGVADKSELEASLNAAFGELSADSTDPQIQAALQKAFALLSTSPETQAAIDKYVKAVNEVATGLDDDEFTLRFQTYVSRNSNPAKVFSGLYAAFQSVRQSPHMVGVNIVGPENGYVAMRDYHLHMQMFAFLKQHFPQTRLAMHAGELALGMVPPEGLRFHIREAVQVAGAERIGHGVDISHEQDAPGLLRQMRERRVVVEVNLTSNDFILGVKGAAHPLPLYIRYGVPFVISTDDAGVSRNNLSGEYLLYASRYTPSYDQLKQTSYNSIRYSFLSEDDKQRELRRLDKRFKAFESEMARQPR